MSQGPIIFRYIFPCLNPRFFSMYANQLFKLYDISLYLSILMIIISFIYFYFVSVPDPSSFKRFWRIFLINLLLGALIPVATLVPRYSLLLTNSNPDVGKATFLLFSAICGLGTIITLIVIFYCFLMLLSFINIPWRLKAMKRYPFNLKLN